MRIVFAEGPETPVQYRRYVGESVDLPDDTLVPEPPWRGRLRGIPGELRDDPGGLAWEIKPVDMRTGLEKLLAEAAELLRVEPGPGERVDDVAMRHAHVQHLLLSAQLLILKREASRG